MLARFHRAEAILNPVTAPQEETQHAHASERLPEFPRQRRLDSVRIQTNRDKRACVEQVALEVRTKIGRRNEAGWKPETVQEVCNRVSHSADSQHH